MTKELKDALQRLIDYNWKDELRDFEEHPSETDCHIFSDMVALENWLNGTSFKPEDYIDYDDGYSQVAEEE